MQQVVTCPATGSFLSLTLLNATVQTDGAAMQLPKALFHILQITTMRGFALSPKLPVSITVDNPRSALSRYEIWLHPAGFTIGPARAYRQAFTFKDGNEAIQSYSDTPGCLGWD